MLRRAAPVLALLAVLLAGCTGTVPGAPTPAAPTATPGPDDQVITLPPRPRDVPLDGVRACDLLTAEQRATLELDGDPLQSDGFDGLTGPGDSCNISGLDRRAIGFSVKLAPATGIEKFTTRLYADTGMTPLDVEGFPALLSPPPPNMQDNCLVLVDVAPGQVLAVMLADGGDEPQIPVSELCREVPRFTAEVMRTLLAR